MSATGQQGTELAAHPGDDSTLAPSDAPPTAATPDAPAAVATTARGPSWITRLSRILGVATDALGIVAGGGVRGLFTLGTLAVALFALGSYVYIGVSHVAYRYEIEWMEGGFVDAVHHLLNGGKLYDAPTLAYTPFIYAPLYFYLGAIATAVFGEGVQTLRVLSFGASMITTALIGLIVYRETRSRAFAFVSAALFVATYKLGSSFLDLARVDATFSCFSVAMVYVLRYHPSRRGQIIAAALGTAAFLTKQSGVFIVATVAVTYLASERRRGVTFALASPIFGAASFLVLNLYYEGWFFYYLYWIPKQHPSRPEALYQFWSEDILPWMGFAVLISIGYLAFAEGRNKRIFGAGVVGAMLVGWQGRIHAGGWPNVEIPFFAMLAITTGLGLNELAARVANGPRGRAVAMAAALAQFAVLAYDPRKFVPTAADRAAGDALVDQIRKVKGEVYFPSHGGILLLAGKEPCAQEMAVNDVIGIGGGKPGAALRDEIKDDILEKRFAAVVLDGEFFRHEVEQGYRKQRDVFPSRDGFFTLAGMRTRPKYFYVPK